LKEGQSKNLWYEEVVPHESKFIFLVSIPLTNDIGLDESEFNNSFNDKIVQIGGNASIGYGYCQIQIIN
jgi:CRISPR-associated protein Cmr4